MNKWKQEGQLKKDSSGSSVITHVIKSQERFLHFTSHLASSHIMTEIWALFVTSVDSATSAAINGTALISFISYLTTSPIAAIKSFWIMFQKPENAVVVSKFLANLSSFAARVCKSSTELPRLEEIELSSLLENANCCLAGKQFTLMRSFKISRFSLTLGLWTLTFSIRCSFKVKVYHCASKSFSSNFGFECYFLTWHVCWGLVDFSCHKILLQATHFHS